MATGIDEAWQGSTEAVAYLSADESFLTEKSKQQYLIHPTLLDSTFQSLYAMYKLKGSFLRFLIICLFFYVVLYIPTKIDRITILRPCHYRNYFAYAVSFVALI